MTIQIGRIPAFNEPMSWTNSGDTVQIGGRGGAGSAAAATMFREQLLGLDRNVDENIVPIVATTDPRLSGYYRILGVEVPTTPATFLPQGSLAWTIHAERIVGYASATIESVLIGTLMVNGLGVVVGTTQPFHAAPHGSEYASGVAGAVKITRPISDASGLTTIDWWSLLTTYKTLARYTLDPSIFYAGAATITNLDAPSHVVVGTQEAPLAEGTAAQHWQLSNGLVKVAFSGGGDCSFRCTWVDADTNTFRTTRDIQVGVVGTGGLTCPVGMGRVRILRNAPEQVIIRIPMLGGTTQTLYAVDVALRRGERTVHIYATSTMSSPTWALIAFVPFAATAITGGLVQTTGDAYGNKVALMTSFANTTDLVNGIVTVTGSRPAADFGISMQPVTGSGTYDTAQAQVYQYLAAQAERMQVVGR